MVTRRALQFLVIACVLNGGVIKTTKEKWEQILPFVQAASSLASHFAIQSPVSPVVDLVTAVFHCRNTVAFHNQIEAATGEALRYVEKGINAISFGNRTLAFLNNCGLEDEEKLIDELTALVEDCWEAMKTCIEKHRLVLKHITTQANKESHSKQVQALYSLYGLFTSGSLATVSAAVDLMSNIRVLLYDYDGLYNQPWLLELALEKSCEEQENETCSSACKQVATTRVFEDLNAFAALEAPDLNRVLLL